MRVTVYIYINNSNNISLSLILLPTALIIDGLIEFTRGAKVSTAKLRAVYARCTGDYCRMDDRERVFCLTATTRVSFSVCPTIFVSRQGVAFKRRSLPRLPHRKSRRKQSIECHNAYANRNETLYPER